jgi:hypothetical protein
MNDEHARETERGYETRDVSLRDIVAFGIALAALCTVSAILLAWLFRAFEHEAARTKRSRFPLAVEQGGQAPPEPRLEGLDRLANDQPRLPIKAKPDEFGERLQEAFRKLEGKLPARSTPPTFHEPPGDASSGRNGRRE